MLEPLVDAWDEEPSSDIKMHLLTAAVKLFFKRPPEMQVCAVHPSLPRRDFIRHCFLYATAVDCFSPLGASWGVMLHDGYFV